MRTLLAVADLHKTFQTAKGTVTVLREINLEVQAEEFLSIVGHSGCGKSTLLHLLSGLDSATTGSIRLDGQTQSRPGPDRMVVFQDHCLLPWLTVRQNVALAVERVFAHQSPRQRQGIVEEALALVGLQQAAGLKPDQISGGMRQRVGLARALAIRPRVLFLDEPFTALDALTRSQLQEELMGLASRLRLTVVMITHDVDEALLLSDRIVMLTPGPGSTVGSILEVPLPRPRQVLEVVHHPLYASLRRTLLSFLYARR